MSPITLFGLFVAGILFYQTVKYIANRPDNQEPKVKNDTPEAIEKFRADWREKNTKEGK